MAVLLLTRGADNSRPDYAAPSCPNSRDLGTAEKAGEAPPLTPGVLRTPSVLQESTSPRLTGPLAVQGLFRLLTKGPTTQGPIIQL